MAETLISIIVPVYNVEKYLRKCLDSIINQTYSNLEIICVNDGATDSSRSILEEYAAEDKRIKIIDKKNGGLSDARNAGLSCAGGEYLMFVDSDDWLEITACEKSIRIAEEQQVDVVMWPYIREFGQVSLPKNMFEKDMYFDKRDTYEKIYRRFFGLYGEELAHPENADALVTVWGKLYKSELILKNHIQFVDTRQIATCEDALFNIEVFSYVKTSYFYNCALYHYRKNDSSFTAGYKPDLKKKWAYLYEKMKDEIDQNKLDKIFSESLYNRIALNVIGLGFNTLGCREGFGKRYRIIQEFLSDPVIHRAVKRLDLAYLPVHWKAFFVCARMRAALSVYFLIFVMNKLRSK